MSKVIVHANAPVTLIGGGELGPGDLAEALALAPRLVAADGGARAALAAGHKPEAVIGDFDSLRPEDRDMLPAERLFPIREQDTTDFDKALRSISAPLVLAVGFLGARIDHQLAAFNTLVRLNPTPCILIGRSEIVLHLPAQIALPTRAGDIVSLFPMLPVTGRSTGLEWPIDGLDLAPRGRVGTSNRATGPARIETDGPGLLAILPRALLADMTAGFALS